KICCTFSARRSLLSSSVCRARRSFARRGSRATSAALSPRSIRSRNAARSRILARASKKKASSALAAGSGFMVTSVLIEPFVFHTHQRVEAAGAEPFEVQRHKAEPQALEVLDQRRADLAVGKPRQRRDWALDAGQLAFVHPPP